MIYSPSIHKRFRKAIMPNNVWKLFIVLLPFGAVVAMHYYTLRNSTVIPAVLFLRGYIFLLWLNWLNTIELQMFSRCIEHYIIFFCRKTDRILFIWLEYFNMFLTFGIWVELTWMLSSFCIPIRIIGFNGN